MPCTDMIWGTELRIMFSDGKHVFINMPVMQMVKMSIVEKVGVALMLNFRVAAVFMVNVLVGFMRGVVGHH